MWAKGKEKKSKDRKYVTKLYYKEDDAWVIYKSDEEGNIKGGQIGDRGLDGEGLQNWIQKNMYWAWAFGTIRLMNPMRWILSSFDLRLRQRKRWKRRNSFPLYHYNCFIELKL